MDCVPCSMICFGSQAQNWGPQPPQSVLSQVKVIAGSDESICLLLKDGSLYSLGVGKLASDVTDIFAGDNRIYTLGKDGQLHEWPLKAKAQNVVDYTSIPFPLPRKQKVVQLACGNSHMLLLTKFGEVFAKGDNTYGQCGFGKKSLDTISELQLVKSLRGLPISQITSGGWNSFCVTVSGRVLAWGQNEFGQLGLEGTKATKIMMPTFMEFSAKNSVAFISAGEHHTALLTKRGGLYTCGKNSHGQLGHKHISKHQSTPVGVEELIGSVVTQVVCGKNHMIAYVSGCRQVFGCGDNTDSQLGILGDQNFISTPVMLSGPWCDDQNVVVQKVFAVGNTSLILYSESFREALDYGPVPEPRKIAKIDENMCEKMTRLDEDSEIYEDLLKELGSVFSSLSCLTASFSIADNGSVTKDFLCIDFVLARELMTRLCRSINAEACDIIVTSLKKGIVQNLPSVSKDIEALKVYAILPIVVMSVLERGNVDADFLVQKIPHRCVDDVFIPFVEKSLGSHKDDIMRLLKLVDQEYFSSLLDLCKIIIIEVLFGAFGAKTDQERLQCIVEMLKILFDINVKFRMVNYKKFCIADLPESLLFEHYLQWKGRKPKTTGWNFCECPSLLDAKAKTTLLQINSKVRLQDVFNVNLFLPVDRKNLLGSANALEKIKDIQRPLEIKFIGEEGVDDGALTKEFFMLIFDEILKGYGLFDENETSHFLWFPKKRDDITLNLYNFIGKLCGMALYNGVIVHFNLPLALYKELLGEKPNLDDLVQIDPTVGYSLKQLLDFTEEDDLTVEKEFFLNFMTPDGTPLIEGGEDIPVTSKNRKEFVDHYLEYFFHKSVQAKLDAFRNGFFEACCQDMLSLFRPEELMEMVTGIEDYDWEALKKSTKYVPINCPEGGFDKLHPVIVWFWEVLLSLSKEEKDKFLIFLTGTNKIPITGLHMTIKQRLEDDIFLPTAEVCYNALHLHTYSSKEILEERLKKAIECKGFHMI